MFGGITVFDKKEFIEGVIAKGRSLDEIISEARAEIRQIESRTIRPAGSSDNVRFLRILVFFLISEVKVKPANLSDDNSRLLFRITKYLVDQGRLKPDILELFGTG